MNNSIKGSSGEDRAMLGLEPLSKTQSNRINHIIDKMLVDTDNKACQHHGESKHDARQTARANGAKGSHEIAKAIKNRSESTEDKYKSCFRALMQYAYQKDGCKDPMQIKADHIVGFCAKLVENCYAQKTFENYVSAFNYWGAKGGVLDQYQGLNGGVRGNPWDNVLREVAALKYACVDKEHFRAYGDGRGIVENLSGPAKIAAELQYTCGLRISDATYIKAENWDAARGVGVCNSKGGQAIYFKPSAELAARITDYIKTFGSFKVSHAAYYGELRGAVAKSGQVWEGSHGLRAAFAVNNMLRCKAAGMTYKQALRDTGEKLGHHRGMDEVTKTYVAGVEAW